MHTATAANTDAHESLAVDIDEINLRQRVFAERVRQFMVRERLAALSGVAPALYLASLNWHWVNPHVVMLWCTMLWLIDFATVVHTSWFLRRPEMAPEQLRPWCWRQVALQSLAGLAWGASVPLFHASDMTHNAYNDVVLVAVNSVAIIALLPLWVAVVSFSVGLWLAPMAFCLYVGDVIHLQLACGILVLVLSLNFYTWSAAHDLVQGIERRFRADTLAEALRLAVLRIHELATHDELTGAANRREGMRVLTQAHEQHCRRQRDLSILLIDIDHFKQINDTHGHPVGDLVLESFCTRIQTALRKTETLARVGGEEFMIVLPDASHQAALAVAHRVRDSLISTPLLTEPTALHVTASFGLATLRAGETVQQCLARADAALYEAKNRGRDQVALAA